MYNVFINALVNTKVISINCSVISTGTESLQAKMLGKRAAKPTSEPDYSTRHGLLPLLKD
jgi:hypothetical protein